MNKTKNKQSKGTKSIMTKKQMQQKILSLEKQLKLLYNVIIKNKGVAIND
ncbi:MAG: hypothetical protein ACQKHC_00620 [Candidatus Phytoplasma pruni]